MPEGIYKILSDKSRELPHEYCEGLLKIYGEKGYWEMYLQIKKDAEGDFTKP